MWNKDYRNKFRDDGDDGDADDNDDDDDDDIKEMDVHASSRENEDEY